MPSQTSLIRISIVEDDVLFMSDFLAAINTAPDMVMANTANTLEGAFGFLFQKAEPPDVLVVDLGLPDGSGLHMIRLAHERWPKCAVMVSTAFADELHVIQSIEAGASGYLLKDSSPSQLTDDIRSLHGGGSPISPIIARYILQRFRTGGDVVPPSGQAECADVPALSTRELEVLGLITKGFTYDEIARMLKISRNTVMTFVRRIYAKLEVKSKVEAIYEAHRRRLLRN